MDTPTIDEFKHVRISYAALAYVLGAVIAATFAFAVWMTTINIKLNEQGDAIQALKNVDIRLTRIETSLEELKNQSPRGIK